MQIRTFHILGVLLLTIIFVAGCSSRKKAPDDSFLLGLNGASYDSQSNIGGIPIGNRKLTRLMKGHVQCNAGLGQVPVNHAQVDLLADGKVVSSTYTERDGLFSMAFEVEASRRYELKISTSRWNHSENVYSGPRGLAGTGPNIIFVDCSPK